MGYCCLKRCPSSGILQDATIEKLHFWTEQRDWQAVPELLGQLGLGSTTGPRSVPAECRLCLSTFASDDEMIQFPKCRVLQYTGEWTATDNLAPQCYTIKLRGP
jgi:hypothetical protein